MTVELENLVATTQSKDDSLGHLFWFSIGQQMNKVDELEQKLINSGVGKEWMPNPIRPVDAFRRATRETQTKKPTATAGVYQNFLMREIYSDNEIVQRNIVVETVDQKDKKLGYETQSGVIKLDKKNGTFSYEATDSEILELCKEAEQKFYLYRDHYSGQHIRVMVTKILGSLAPTPMRKNGMIYFIPKAMNDGLNNLVTFIRSLDNSEGYQVPVIDSTDNRHMVNTKLEDHLDSLLEQCKNSEDLAKGQVKALVDETNAALNDYKQYRGIIASEKESFEDKVVTLRSEVVKVIEKNN